jgi:aminoglycoside 3-N-acetyltransferase
LTDTSPNGTRIHEPARPRQARLARSRDIVGVVTERLHRDETIFLHPPGVDEECDEARASLLS